MPICPIHGSPMRQGRSGFFCPRKNDDGSYCDERVNTPKQQPQQRPVNGAGAPRPAGQPTDARDRSIEAQACAKAACDVAAAIGPILLAQQDAAPAVVTEFAVTLARRLLREVVYAATGVTVPAGIAMPRPPYAARGLATANTGPAFPEPPDDGYEPFGENR